MNKTQISKMLKERESLSIEVDNNGLISVPTEIANAFIIMSMGRLPKKVRIYRKWLKQSITKAILKGMESEQQELINE